MGRRRSIAVLVVVLLLAAAGLWLFMREPSTPFSGPTAPAPARVPLSARASAIYAGAGEPLIVSVRLFNHVARQAAATNAALEAAGASAPRQAIEPITLAIAPEAWAAAVRFSRGGGEPTVPSSQVRVVTRPDGDRHAFGDTQTIRVVFEIAPEAAATLGDGVVATAALGDWRVDSNRVPLAPPADAVGRLLTRARTARASGDHAKLLETGDAIVAADVASPWGYWYRGLALEARNARAEALVAYEAAAARLPPAADGHEPPVDLFRRIAALR